MSRSAPNEMMANPATRWFEWNGDEGNPKYYDKETKTTNQVQLPFEFVLLDRLSVIKGWHNDSTSGITSNEVRDTRSETLYVRAFQMKEPIAEGFYSQIKDRVKAAGGSYAINLYIAYTGDDGEVALGAFTLRGSARNAWMDFEGNKENRPFLYKKGIKIASTAHGEKGSGKRKIEWEAPVFELIELGEGMDDQALVIDSEQLQPYLKSYFKRARHEQGETDTDGETENRTDHSPEYDQRRKDEEEDEIPF